MLQKKRAENYCDILGYNSHKWRQTFAPRAPSWLRHCVHALALASNVQALALRDEALALRFWGSIKNIHLYIFRNLNFIFSILICRSSVFCILALGSGQRLLYRLGSGLGLVLVLVLRFCAYSYGGVCS